MITGLIYGCSAQQGIRSHKVFHPDTIPCKAKPDKPLKIIAAPHIMETNML